MPEELARAWRRWMDHLRGRKGGFCEGHFSQFGSTPIESILFRNPSRETQRELLPAIIWELRNTLDEVLLMWLAERKSVKPSLPAQLIELGSLSRLREHDEHPINLLTRA